MVLKDTASHNLTFEAFVHYLMKTPVEEYDDHWIPQFDHCRPDVIKYDQIVKVENLAELKLTDFQRFLAKKSLKSDQLMQEYLGQLSPKDVANLVKIYAKDFEAFHYRIP